ncbi:MAG: penicillin acylase family protein [Betaproteobacteria bacterium]
MRYAHIWAAKNLWRVAIGVFVLILTVFTVVISLIWASTPQLTGAADLVGLSAAVQVDRDQNGTVVIKAQNWLDATRTIGFVHAQERFFEMDLTRRSAAGELSALFGPETIAMDKAKRMHRFRARMRQNWDKLPADEKKMLSVYAEGVNAGLRALPVRPWQYLLVNASPEPWREEDSLLVIAEMYYVLQSRNINDAYAEALLRERIGDKLFNWMKPRGGSFDAALDGSVWPSAEMPSAAEIDTRSERLSPTKVSSWVATSKEHEVARDEEFKPGSNNWAVSAARSRHGVPMIADDMHLSLSVPNIWFRSQFELKEGADRKPVRLAGISLPGVPGLVVGSNGAVAWGFTSAEGDWFDWIPVRESSDGSQYVDGSQSRPFEVVNETITVRGLPDVKLAIRHTPLGPVIHAHGGRAFVLNWLAHWPGAVDARLEDMLWTTDVDAAILVAQSSGVPQQNILIADAAGNIAWTIAGRMPKRRETHAGGPRKGFSAGADVPSTWLSRESYPVMKNPPDGRLWTANSRQLGGAEGEKIGEGRGDLGARARQIRDRLREQDTFDEMALHGIQRDAEARFLNRWVSLVGRIAESQSQRTGFSEVKQIVASWNGRADADQSTYAIARTFRINIQEKLKNTWVQAAAPNFKHHLPRDGRMEYAVWSAVSEQPTHLLPLPFKSWDEFLAQELADVITQFNVSHGSLEAATWGRINAAKITHPISEALPWLGHWLNMPATPLGGDNHMPMVATKTDGASQRMVVAPGREASGILSMPGGQSGHPLSPFYGAGHRDWLDGTPTPFLAGPARHTMIIRP